MAYTVNIIMPKEKKTGMMFRTKSEAENFLTRLNYTYFGNDTWVEQLRWIPEQTMTVVIEELKYEQQ